MVDMQIPKMEKRDWIAVAALVIFVVLVSIPTYVDKGDCEVAQAGYKCNSIKNVLIENCNYWGNFSCDSSKDVSLPQVEWYIGNLCKLGKDKYGFGDCANLRSVCNGAVGTVVCPAS